MNNLQIFSRFHLRHEGRSFSLDSDKSATPVLCKDIENLLDVNNIINEFQRDSLIGAFSSPSQKSSKSAVL